MRAVFVSRTLIRWLLGSELAWILVLVLYFDRARLVNEQRLHQYTRETGKRLAVVVPFVEADLDRLEANVATWLGAFPPCQRAFPARSATDIVLYYHREFANAPAVVTRLHALRRTVLRTRCFDKVLFAMANLDGGLDTYPLGASLMFFRLLDLPLIADNYAYLYYSEPDNQPCRPYWLDRVYALAAVTGPGWWQIGASMRNGDPAATHYPYADHINGNALYRVDSPAFMRFVETVQDEFSKNKSRFMGSFDIAMYMVARNLMPFPWYMENKHRWVYTDVLFNAYRMRANATEICAANAETFMVHGRNLVW